MNRPPPVTFTIPIIFSSRVLCIESAVFVKALYSVAFGGSVGIELSS